MLNIAVSSRSLAAARTIDPHVSPAAVYAAVEAAIAEQLRQLGRAPAAPRDTSRPAGPVADMITGSEHPRPDTAARAPS